MLVIGSKEFAANQEKYFDMAKDEEVCVKRGEDMFQLMYCIVNETDRKRMYYEPDEDFCNSISARSLKNEQLR